MGKRTNSFKSAVVILILFSAFSLPRPSFAQLENPDLPNREGIKFGSLVLHGALKAREELETNIFLSNDNRRFDAITVVSPSVGVELPVQKHRFSADYNAGIFMYGTYNSQNHVDHRLRGLAEINLTRFKIKGEDTFVDFTDRSVDENSRRVQRKNNTFRVGVETRQFNRLTFDVGYTNLLEIYGQPDDLIYQSITYGDRDRMSNIVDATASYRFWPKTSLFFESDLGFIHYYNSSLPPDSYFIEFLVGAKGRPTNKIRVNLKGGFRYQGYGDSAVMNDKDFFGPVASGGLEYALNKDNLFDVGIESRVFESTYQNMNYYHANLFSLKYTHKFTDKLSMKPFGFYQLNLYPSKSMESGSEGKRYDNYFGGGIAARYDIRKWASIELSYEYTQRSSKFDIYDYIDNRIMFNGTVGF